MRNIVVAASFLFWLIDATIAFSSLVATIEYAGKYPTSPFSNRQDALKEMKTNLQNYLDLASSSTRSLDTNPSIFVFSEDGLYGPAFPDKSSILAYLEEIPPIGSSIPHNDSLILSAIADLASQLNSTVVVNMGEIVLGKNSEQYNVNVVVSSNRYLISKYRKRHLYYEPSFDSGDNILPFVVFTEPSSGMKYGLVTCNDMTFEDSLAPLIQLGVNAIIAPAWWVNLPPLMSGTSYFLALSYSYHTTFIVAGCGQGWYCSGSGIFSNGKIIASQYNSNYLPVSKMMIATLDSQPQLIYSAFRESSKDASSNELSSWYHRHYQNILASSTNFVTSNKESNVTLLRFSVSEIGEAINVTVKSRLGLTCHVEGTVGAIFPSSSGTTTATSSYWLGVVSVRGYAPEIGFSQWPIEYCGLVYCPTSTCLSSLVLQSLISLGNVTLSANFDSILFRHYPIILEDGASYGGDSIQSTCESVEIHSTDISEMKCSNSRASVIGTLSLSILGIHRE